MHQFSLIDAPLQHTVLIEASAGTGKTYTLTGLYGRLIVEKGLTVDQILVVTFTVAATEELKSRIRSWLASACADFKKKFSADGFVNALIQRQPDHGQAIEALQDALANLDQAAIYTIHGFCQRILHDYALETGRLFDGELVTAQTHVRMAVADDFWRRHLYTAPPEITNYLAGKIKGPEYFMHLKRKTPLRNVRYVPKRDAPDWQGLIAFKDQLMRVQVKWHDYRSEIEPLLQTPALKANIYGKTEPNGTSSEDSPRHAKIRTVVARVEKWLFSNGVGIPLEKALEYLTRTKLIRATKKGQAPPDHPLFDLCDTLYKAAAALQKEADNYLVHLKGVFLDYAENEIQAQNRRHNRFFFDDLLYAVSDALSRQTGSKLIEAVRRQYKAALVDEFQDTDSIQYTIFDTLFSDPADLLYLIGDPKQAIYGFRGADIFAYMRASRNIKTKRTLFANYRADPALIEAINTLFASHKAPFIFPEITFQRAQAPRPSRKMPAEFAHPGLTLGVLPTSEGGTLNKTDAEQLCTQMVAQATVTLLQDKSNDFNTSDIAILVRTNRQAQRVRSACADLQIPAVLYSAGSVFDTHEATELERLLMAIAEPFQEPLARAALITDLIGMRAAELSSTFPSDQAVDSLMRFWDYHVIWQQHGFYRMFRTLLNRETIKPRLLMYPDGERRLTNLLHLAELLQKAEQDMKLGARGLLKWLNKERQAVDEKPEDQQLRLESDYQAVKIITIHKSKGLEFPVVFYPFGWDRAIATKSDVVFHDPQAHEELTLDLGFPPRRKHQDLARKESMAENMRLLYVALTRAQKHCFVFWGPIAKTSDAALACLLRGRDRHAADRPASHARKPSTDAWRRALNGLASRSKGAIALKTLKLAQDPKPYRQADPGVRLQPRRFKGRIDRSWRIASYSYLTRQPVFEPKFGDLYPDYDAVQSVVPPVDDIPVSGDANRFKHAFSFPRGARTGLLLHAILEELEFNSSDLANRQELVHQKLNIYGFDNRWSETIMTLLQSVLDLKLLHVDPDFSLSSLRPLRRISEMQFYYPLKTIQPGQLQKVLEDNAVSVPSRFPDTVGRLDFRPLGGFMRGYIDLVFQHKGRFYLIDWKTNYLGCQPADYRADRLEAVMTNELYLLQAYLYSLALHQYLQVRLPAYRFEQHFGGCLYIFLRGIHSHRETTDGIYWCAPHAKLITDLGCALIPDFERSDS